MELDIEGFSFQSMKELVSVVKIKLKCHEVGKKNCRIYAP